MAECGRCEWSCSRCWVTQQPAGGYPLPTPWAPFEPTGTTSVNCVYMQDNGELAVCTLSLAFICECDDWANDPTQYTTP